MPLFNWICRKCGKKVPLNSGNSMFPSPNGCNEIPGSGGMPPGDALHDWGLENAILKFEIVEPNWHCIKCDRHVPKKFEGEPPPSPGNDCNNTRGTGSSGNPPGHEQHSWVDAILGIWQNVENVVAHGDHKHDADTDGKGKGEGEGEGDSGANNPQGTLNWICRKCSKKIPLRAGEPMPPSLYGCNDVPGSGGVPPGASIHDWTIEGSEIQLKFTEPNWHCVRCDKSVPVRKSPTRPAERTCNNIPGSGGYPQGNEDHYWEKLPVALPLRWDEEKEEEDLPLGEPNWHCIKCGQKPKSASARCPRDGGPHMWGNEK